MGAFGGSGFSTPGRDSQVQDGFYGAQSGVSATGSPPKSSMLEQELRAIEKIKEKQKKEVEQMIDYEMKLTEIKARHEEKARLAGEKEQRRQLEVKRKQKEQEEKKERDDAIRK